MSILLLRGISNVLSDPMYSIDGGVFDHVGIGVWMCLVGGMAAIVSALPIGRRS